MMNKKLKQYLAILGILVIAFGCKNSKEETKNTEPTFTIEAKIDSLNYKMAYLATWADGGFVKNDSMAIEQGMFVFTGKVESPNVQYILFDNTDERITLFVENSTISISGTNLQRENITITGSMAHDEMERFNVQQNQFEEKLKEIIREYNQAKEQGDKTLMEKLDIDYEHEDSLRGVFIENYIKDNSNSVVASYVLMFNMYRYELEQLEQFNNNFSDSIKDSEYVKLIDEKITVLKNSAVGKQAPLFSMNDRDGNLMTLESFKGSYVLVDFWASWCAPCRAENPNVLAAYNKYHTKGFEILGVSFDTDKEKWLDAIEKDELLWFHVSDLKGWGNAAGKIYGVNSIPHSVLIDKEGIIIAKDLRGEALHEKLEEIFNANS